MLSARYIPQNTLGLSSVLVFVPVPPKSEMSSSLYLPVKCNTSFNGEIKVALVLGS